MEQIKKDKKTRFGQPFVYVPTVKFGKPKQYKSGGCPSGRCGMSKPQEDKKQTDETKSSNDES